MTHNLKLGYSGGSGGFLLFHLLLLSGKYSTIFDSADDLTTIINEHWNISDHLSWKKTEIPPNNDQLLNTDLLTPKLYFVSNPYTHIVDWWENYNAKSLIIYTDLLSQQILEEYKNAHRCGNTNQKQWAIFYDSIKGKNWPPCSKYSDMIHLPNWIQKELIEFGANGYSLPIINSIMFGDTAVVDDMYIYLISADYTIKLQDLVNSNGDIMVELLGIPPINKHQRDLLSHWRSLHSNEILDKIGIVY